MNMKSKSLLEPGDKFRFRGLRGGGSDNDDNGENERLITVFDISVTGSVSIRIDMPGLTKKDPIQKAFEQTLKPEWEKPEESSLHSIPYDLALRLVDEGIWQSVRVTL